MPPTVTVWCKDRNGRLRPIRDIDLEQTEKVWLADYPSEGPLFEVFRGGEDLWLYVAPRPVKNLWFVGYFPYRRRRDIEAEKSDGRVYAEDLKGETQPFTPEAWESSRQHIRVSEEEAKALVRHYEVEEEAQALAQYYGKARPSDSSAPLVILGEFGDEPTVNGKRKRRLTKARYDVVKALLAAGDGELSKDSLATQSKHGDAHRILKRLADSDPDWGSVIQMAGKPGCRYRIRTGSLPTSPDISRKAPT
jgi:hypothetical protein